MRRSSRVLDFTFFDPQTGFFSGEVWDEKAGWISFELVGQPISQLRTSCTAPSCTPTLTLAHGGSTVTDLTNLCPGRMMKLQLVNNLAY